MLLRIWLGEMRGWGVTVAGGADLVIFMRLVTLHTDYHESEI
jgi:hypothetical protein